MKTKKIEITEFTYVLHAYPATVEVSVEDFEKLETYQKNIQAIEEKIPSYADKKSKGFDAFMIDEEIIDQDTYENELKIEEENIKTILDKYDIDYAGYSEPIYDDSYIYSYEYDGEV